jgi:hypothetical protein
MILDDEDILIQAATDSARYEMVDLGLSVKWANKNVGASHPEDAGLYFQWGDTIGYTADQVGKDKVFDWDNYKFGTYSNLTKYNSTDKLTVLESSDDAATVHMGSRYRIPTYDEIQELINNTTQTFIDLDGNEYSKERAQNGAIEQGRLKGVRFTGSNGNSIFIPATGYCDGYLLIVNRMSGRLWFSDFCNGNGYDYYANSLYFGCGGMIYSDYYYRYYGFPVRGVE